jgi:hypothetical protein
VQKRLRKRLIKTIPPQLLSDKEKVGNTADMQGLMSQQAEMGQQLQDAQGELQKLTQENQTLKVQREAKEKELQIREYEAETKRLEAYAAILKDGAEINLQKLEQEARQALETEESEHGRNMDVANLMQDQAQFNQGQEHSANQADADRAAQAEAAKAKANSNSQKSAPTD